MAALNDKTTKTEKIIHLLVTPLCLRNCKYCCNKQYNLSDIPIVTEEELSKAEVLCLTGGEPFVFSDPNQIATYYKRRYKNIKKVYVYTNASELASALWEGKSLKNIDGCSVSIKTTEDVFSFKEMLLRSHALTSKKSNRLYVFDQLWTEEAPGFEVIQRTWQADFKPADDSIFRRL